MKHTFHCLPSCLLSPTDVSGGHLPNNYLTSNPCLRICFERNSNSKKKRKERRKGEGRRRGGRKKEDGMKEKRRKEIKNWEKNNTLNPITLILQLFLGKLSIR